MQDTNPVPRQASFVEITGDPNLPDVLLIGDSISMGYAIPTRERLKGRANVHRPSENCGPTSRGLAELEVWLGTRRWDVIHFNWGLHDLKYADGEGRHLTSVDQYKENLGKLISRLKTTGAKLIWATTTPVPAGANGRKQGDAATYNAAAMEIMNQPGITINDLYTFALPRLKEIQLPQNVHFTNEGLRASRRSGRQSYPEAPERVISEYWSGVDGGDRRKRGTSAQSLAISRRRSVWIAASFCALPARVHLWRFCPVGIKSWKEVARKTELWDWRG